MDDTQMLELEEEVRNLQMQVTHLVTELEKHKRNEVEVIGNIVRAAGGIVEVPNAWTVAPVGRLVVEDNIRANTRMYRWLSS